MFAPLPDNNHIIFSDDIKRAHRASFSRFSRKDAEIYPAFDRYLGESTQIVRKLLLETPPDPSCRDWRSSRNHKTAVEIPQGRRKIVPADRSADDERLGRLSTHLSGSRTRTSRRCWRIIAASAPMQGRARLARPT